MGPYIRGGDLQSDVCFDYNKRGLYLGGGGGAYERQFML